MIIQLFSYKKLKSLAFLLFLEISYFTKGNENSVDKNHSIGETFVNEELRNEAIVVGFKYFHVICRILELSDESFAKKTSILKSSLDVKIWSFYDSGTSTIELVRKGNIQKVYFRVKDRASTRTIFYFREDFHRDEIETH